MKRDLPVVAVLTIDITKRRKAALPNSNITNKAGASKKYKDLGSRTQYDTKNRKVLCSTLGFHQTNLVF